MPRKGNNLTMSDQIDDKSEVPPVIKDTPPMGEVTSDDRLWALLAHLSYFVLGIFGPLIIWLVKKEESAFVEDQAKEALNFQLSVLIATLVCGATCILSPLIFVIAIGGIVYTIIAAIESNKGIYYRYPYTFRMIS
jgi:uncharacterized Tic20 family protein